MYPQPKQINVDYPPEHKSTIAARAAAASRTGRDPDPTGKAMTYQQVLAQEKLDSLMYGTEMKGGTTASKLEEDKRWHNMEFALRQAGLKKEAKNVGQEELDKNLAKAHSTYIGGSGYQRAMDSIDRLEKVKEKINELNPKISKYQGMSPEVLRPLLDQQQMDIENNMVEALGSTFKEMYGSRPSTQEVIMRVQSAYNRKLSPEQNYERVSDMVDNLKVEAQQRYLYLKQFEQNGMTTKGMAGEAYVPKAPKAPKQAPQAKQPQQEGMEERVDKKTGKTALFKDKIFIRWK
jgi:hypothetical protein